MPRFAWLSVLRDAFAASAKPEVRDNRNDSKLGIGVCPGCRRLRAVASLRCTGCGSAAPVTEDV